VVALGSPLAGATVSIVDASSATADPAPVTTAADGSFSVDATGLQAPIALRAVGTSQGDPVTLVSVLSALTANATNTMNVTPLTHALSALVAPGGDPAALLAQATLASSVTASNFDGAAAALRASLAAPSLALALGAGFHPVTTPFSANGSGIDAVLDRLQVSVTAQGVRILNRAAPVADGAGPTPVTLTAAQVLNPSSAPALPDSAAAADLPSAADIETVRTKLQACMAVPSAQRITYDTTGTQPLALAAACDFADGGYRNKGRTWVEDMGRLDPNQLNFARRQLVGATFGTGAVALALAPQGRTETDVFKHPQCNAGPCAVVRYPVVSTSGGVEQWEVLFGRVGGAGGAWAIVGDQLPYGFDLRFDLTRFLPANTAPNPGDVYGFKPRYESRLTFDFDPLGRNGQLVRAVRLKGPGLPAAGLVFHRSMRCGTHYRFPQTNQTGSLRNPANNAVLTFNDGSGSSFTLQAANLDGSALAMPAAFTLSPAAVPDLPGLIPYGARYVAEIFLFSNMTTPDSPDERVPFRIETAGIDAAQGPSFSWPTMNQGFVDAYLTPTGSGAGVVTGGLTLDWLAPAGVTVQSGYLFRQDRQVLTNVNGVTTAYTKRGLLSFEPAAYGDRTAPSTRLRDVRSGASLAAETANVAPNPNPRCTDPALVSVNSDSFSYYEAALAFRASGQRRLSAAWFWDN
jgi:hypothetical protein